MSITGLRIWRFSLSRRRLGRRYCKIATMPEETHANALPPYTKRLYVCISLICGLWAAGGISALIIRPRFHFTDPPWMIWLNVVIAASGVWIFFQLFSAVSNRLERPACFLCIVLFALSIPSNLHSLGYSWAFLPGREWINAVLATVVALLMFLRTFQVFKIAKHGSATRDFINPE